MPTKKPRVNVTLEPEDYQVAVDLAELNDQSVSSVIAEAFHDIAPMLANVIRAGKAFKAAQASVRDDVREAFEEADQVIAPEIAALQADIIERLQEIATIAEIGAEDPRPVIRGSRTPTPHLHPVPKGGRLR